MNMEQHVNTLLTVYGEDLNRLRNRVGKDRSENTFRAQLRRFGTYQGDANRECESDFGAYKHHHYANLC